MIDFKDNNCLVTGGAGFIGSDLVHRLVGLEANVTVIDSLAPFQGGNMFNLGGVKDKIEFKNIDIREDISEFMEDKDYVFHLAAHTSHMRSVEHPMEDFQINALGTLNILEVCRKSNSNIKIIYTGTRSQYGRIIKNPVDEAHPLNPLDMNGIAKLTAENYCMLYNKVYGIEAVSLRLTNTYGPRQQMKSNKLGFMSWSMRLALDNEEIKVFDGNQIRDLNFVDDVVDAILMSASDKTDGEVLNVGSGIGISLLDIVKKIIKIAGSGSYTVHEFPEDNKKIEIGDYIANITKIKNLIGWKPKVILEEGLKTTFEYYRKYKEKYW